MLSVVSIRGEECCQNNKKGIGLQEQDEFEQIKERGNH